MSRFHWKLVGVSGIGWMFDSMDVGIISFVVATLAREWGLGPSEVAWTLSIGLLGMLVGAAVSGSLADRFGRKTVFQWTVLIFSVGTGLSGLAWSYASLLGARFLTGFGLGGELPIASTLVSEFAPAKRPGQDAGDPGKLLGLRLDSGRVDRLLRHTPVRLAGGLPAGRPPRALRVRPAPRPCRSRPAS